MASKNAVLNIIFGADTKDLDKALGGVAKRLRRTAEDVGSLGQSLSVGLSAPLAVLGGLATKNAVDSAKALAQVEAAVTSTGGAAGRSVGQLEEMATSLQRMSLFDDDQILKEVTANLLTFTRVTGKEFDQAQVAILNMSTRLGTDLTSASIQVGKALNDPIKGVKALGRAGVQFTAEQKAQIEVLQESGDIAGAQAIILKELETQFGGAAQAAANTDPYTQLSNEVGNLSEDFGKIINEALLPLIGYVRRAVDAIKGWSDETKTTVLVIGGLLAVLGPTLVAVGSLINAYTTIKGALALAQVAQLKLNAAVLANPYVLAAAAVGVLIAALVLYKTEAQSARQEHEEFTKSLAREGVARVQQLGEKMLEMNDTISDAEEELARLKRTSNANNNSLSGMTNTTTSAIDAQQKLVDELKAEREELSKLRTAAIQQTNETNKRVDAIRAYEQSQSSATEVTKGETKAQKDLYDAFVKRSKAWQEQYDLNEELSESERELRLDFIRTLDEVDRSIAAWPQLRQEVQGLTVDVRALGQAIEDELGDEFIPEEAIEGQDQIVDRFNRTKQAAQDVAAAIESTAQSITVNFAEMLGAAIATGDGMQGFGSMLLGSLADLAVQVGKIAVGVGISIEGIKAALENFNPAVAIAAGIALIAIGSAAKNALANRAESMGGTVPALASGGLTTGPTLAMIGDNPSGKEAVIPFERMGEFLDMAGAGQSQHITVSGRIAGNDILFINERTGRDRSRVRGY